MFELLLTVVTVFALCVLLTRMLCSYLAKGGMLDVPNGRSSHTKATPRGGGLSIALGSTAGLYTLSSHESDSSGVAFAMIAGGLLVAVVGLTDDRYRVPPGLKLASQFAVALWAVAWVGGLHVLAVHNSTLALGWTGDLLTVLGFTWVLNLFNFMDGIDGIAASEAVFVLCAGAVLMLVSGTSNSVPFSDLIVGAAALGFLVWNWPPAKLFMGDIGSGYLGYAIAVSGLAAARESATNLWVWLILGGVFVVDATFTLVRRVVSRESIFQAHCDHAYQRLASRWGHRTVTVAVGVVNVAWLLPCAALAAIHPVDGAALTLVALAPLIGLSVIAGAGRANRRRGISHRTRVCATDSVADHLRGEA